MTPSQHHPVPVSSGMVLRVDSGFRRDLSGPAEPGGDDLAGLLP